MQTRFYYKLFAIAGLIATCPAPAIAATAAELAPHATGICLAEVLDVEELDERPGDGPLYLRVPLKVVRSTGAIQNELHVILEDGGHPSPEPPEPVIDTLPREGLKKGARYWLAFASRYDRRRLNPGSILASWPEADSTATATFDAAIAADEYRWQPQFDPKTGLTLGQLSEPGAADFTVRIQRDGKTLWQKQIAGQLEPNALDFCFYPQEYEGFPRQMPSCGKILSVPALVELKADNEFELPAGPTKLTAALDPENGRRLAVWIFRVERGYEKRLFRDYDPKTEKLLREDRFRVIPSGGFAVGAERDEWFQMTTRRFNPDSGAVIDEKLYWYDDRSGVDQRWKPVAEGN